MDRFAFHQVDESAWRGHNELLGFFECPELILDGRSAVHREDVQSRDVLCESMHLIRDLLAKFTRGCKDERLRVLCGLRFEVREKWEAKSRCFSRTGLGQSDKIGFFCQEQGDGLKLDLAGCLESEVLDRRKQGIWETKVLK